MNRPDILSAAAVAGLVVLGLLTPAVGEAKGPGKTGAGYVGSETCIACHEGFDKSIEQSRHAFARNPRAPAAAQGCESCHGPGEAHANDQSIKPFQPRKAPAKEATDQCMACHDRAEHANFPGGAHDARGLTCVTCHSVHRPESENALLVRSTEGELCAQCHRDKVRKLQRSGHMPVREGKMECTSCHGPHGSQNDRMLRAGRTVNESCESCHTEKRGPFLYEHAPVRDGCVNCHDPHGSSNDRLLVAKAPFLCQRCHVGVRHTSLVYDTAAVAARSNRVIGRSCVNCHSQLHGSNHPSGATYLR